MEFLLLSDQEKKVYEEEIFSLLKAADDDFLPPLSQRCVDPVTNRNTFSDVPSDGNIRDYASAMARENILAIFEDGALCGFVSFAENLENDVITEIPNIYIGTAVISEKLRGRGTLSHTYDYLFSTLYPKHNLFTRTWSTNVAHIRVLDKFGFERIKTLKDDRGDGIDTIYFGKKR